MVAETLEILAARLTKGGFAVRRVGFFSPDGLLIAIPPEEGEAVVQRSVCLYHDGAWKLRLTQHGGQHWTRTVDSHQLENLENTLLDVLADLQRPPPGWTEEF